MKKVFVISNMYPSKEHLSYGIFVKNQVEQLRAQGIETILAVNTNPNTGKVNVLKNMLAGLDKYTHYFEKINRVSGLPIAIMFFQVGCSLTY